MIGRQEDLTNTVIAADALNARKDTARAIVERGGEYCIQVKGNQETIRQEAELSTKELAPLWKGSERFLHHEGRGQNAFYII
jgi:hypothetical protein